MLGFDLKTLSLWDFGKRVKLSSHALIDFGSRGGDLMSVLRPLDEPTSNGLFVQPALDKIRRHTRDWQHGQ